MKIFAKNINLSRAQNDMLARMYDCVVWSEMTMALSGCVEMHVLWTWFKHMKMVNKTLLLLNTGVHSKNLVAILHLLVALARHFRAPIRLPEHVTVSVIVVQVGQVI